MIEPGRSGVAAPARVAVVRALPGLGDILCAIPALRALRAACPDAHISLIGHPAVAALTARFDRYIDRLLVFPGFPGIPEMPFAVRTLTDFLARVQETPFDLAIQMHGSGVYSNLFTVLLGARRNAGFYLPGSYCADPSSFLPYPAGEPEVRRHLLLMQFLGFSLRGEALEFPLRESDRVDAAALSEEAGGLAPGNYVCIHPGASVPSRRWRPEYFAAVADGLAGQGLQVVLTGSSDEIPITAAVKGAMHGPAIDLAGRTRLGVLAALLTGARLLVCNDTGVSHLAAALQTPSLVIFLASDPRRWAPLDGVRHRRLGWPDFGGREPGRALPPAQPCPDPNGEPAAEVAEKGSVPPATPRHALEVCRSLLLSTGSQS